MSKSNQTNPGTFPTNLTASFRNGPQGRVVFSYFESVKFFATHSTETPATVPAYLSIAIMSTFPTRAAASFGTIHELVLNAMLHIHRQELRNQRVFLVNKLFFSIFTEVYWRETHLGDIASTFP